MHTDLDISWFDLKKYSDVKNFDIHDWSFQLHKRYFVKKFSKQNAEILSLTGKRLKVWKSLNEEQWAKWNKEAIDTILAIKENPILADQHSGSNCSSNNSHITVKTAAISDLYLIKNNSRVIESLNNLDDYEFYSSYDDYPIVDSVNNSPFDRTMVTIDLGASDEQLIMDFGIWLKNYRDMNQYKSLNENFSQINIQKWALYNVLAYLDLTLIAEAQNQQITQTTLGTMLFPDIHNINLTERIRQTVMPLAEYLLDFKTLMSLSFQTEAT